MSQADSPRKHLSIAKGENHMPNQKPPVFNKALLTQVMEWIEENPENTVLSKPLKTKLLRFQELNENEQARLGNELQMISQLPNIINNFMGFSSPTHKT